MTNQTQIIIICGIAGVGIPLGTFVLIKTIKKLWVEPTNVLRRHGDIELQNVVEPIRHNFNREFDLNSLPEYPQAMVNQFPVYGRVPSYRSEIIPSYHTHDRIIHDNNVMN